MRIIKNNQLVGGHIPPELLLGNVTELNLGRCTSLTSLPENLPAGITRLDLDDCTSLTFTPSLIERLSTLEAAGTSIRYPQHFNPDDQVAKAKLDLEAAITSYNIANPDLPKPEAIKNLLHRYLTEGIGQRGDGVTASPKECLKEIISTTTPILEALTKNPNHLKWADEIAKAYLDGCINQPVAGWSEISAIMSIAQAPTVIEKIEATKHLRVLEGVTNYIATLPQDQKPGVEVEAESGNALFREVHKKLLAEGDIEQPWLGVPKSIAYEGMIKSWLSEARITAAYEQTKTILAEPLEQVVDYLCERSHKETWAEIAFPEQVAEIKVNYAKKMSFLDNAIAAKNGDDLDLEGDDEVIKEFKAEYLNDDGAIKYSLEELKTSQAVLPDAQVEEIATKVKELTLNSIQPSNSPVRASVVEVESRGISNSFGD